MNLSYQAWIEQRESRQVADLIPRDLPSGARILDVGCGEGHVATEIAARGNAVDLVDIVDVRTVPQEPFQLFDGLNLPFPDGQFDLVMLNFVLHHVPDENKPRLLREAKRVSRDKIFILEDTPENALDRLMNRRHGEHYRTKIGSHAPFGFLTRREWEWFLTGLGLNVARSRPLGRFCRSPWQPFARSAFLVHVGAENGPAPLAGYPVRPREADALR